MAEPEENLIKGFTSKEEPMETDHYLPEGYAISASELMRDEIIFKKQEIDENKEGITADFHPIFPDSLVLLRKESRMDDGTVAEGNSYSEEQISILHDHSYCINPLKADIRPVKRSNTEINCPKCEYHTRNALSWVKHFSNKHSTTPAQAGFALLCECGIVSQTSTHSRLCDIANFTVISRSTPIIQVNKATPQCILCDTYPATPMGYTAHLKKNHDTTLRANEVFIICSCGYEVYSSHSMRYHREKCNGRQFKLFKQVFEDGQSSLVEPKEEYAEKEVSMRSEDSLIDQPLFRTDNEDRFTENKIYKEESEEAPMQFSLDFPHHDDNVIAESCQYSDEEYSGYSNAKARNESVMKRTSIWKSPSGALFLSVLVKKEYKEHCKKYSDTEIGCPECEYRTRSATAWQTHLKEKHSTNPTLAGFALLCECGNESFSHRHSRRCDISNFTVIRKRDGPIKRLHDAKVTPQCLHCEKYPATGHGYLDHLQRHHKSSLNANGIYLICACGFKITCDSRHLRDHNKTCRRSGFTIHQIEEKRTNS